MNLSKEEFLSMVDHTILRPDATIKEVDEVINFAKNNNTKSICINPCFVKYAKEKLKGTKVLVCTVIGFPLGASTKETKIFEAKDAICNGADEIDMVINISQMKSGNYDYVYDEVLSIKNIGKATLKVIIENAYLTDYEIKKACQICIDANVDFVKTSTGFAKTGATVKDVALMKSVVKDKIKIKAAGGIRTFNDVKCLYESGASRFGISRTEDILNEIN